MEQAFVSQDLCIHDGQTELEDVCHEVTQLDLNETESGMDSCVVIEEETEMQLIQTELRLCRIQHCEGCDNLHLCKLYLFGECPSDNQREKCLFSHDLYSEHNIGVLCQHKLLELDCNELCITLLQNDTTLLPSVCLAYNEGSGEFGNCLEAESCKDLHVCESYIRGLCDGSTGCSRCHDIYEPHPLKTLQDNGVPSQLMSILLPIYKSMLAMADADKSTLISSATAPEERLICLFHFEKSCTLGDSCESEHFYLPYKWEQRHGDSWNVLPDNEEIERAFCDPTKTHSDSSVPVQFDTMTRGSVEVRRLSTISSILDPSFNLATKWIWYFEDEHGDWIQYGSSQGENNISFIAGEFLEWKYQENSRAIIRFTTAGHSYEVNMQDMMQYKKQNGTEMRVRRRPTFLSAEDAQNAIKGETESEDRSQNPQALPYDSDEADVSVTGFERVPLDSDTDQYKKTVARFYRTMGDFNVKSIEKVQNKDLWEVFKRHVNVIKQKNLGKENVKLLFHGTEPKQIDAIFQQNTDWRFCQGQEKAYGKGIYFTKDAKSSHSYTDKSGTQCMFLCQVFTGEYTTGHPSYIHPPLKHGENGIFYDSCVNDIGNPSIFVVFEKHQVYPMYLIQYEKRAGSSPLPVSQNPFSLSTQASFSDPNVFSQHSARSFFPVLTYTTPNLLSAPKFHFTPMVRPPFFAHLKEINFQRSAARFPFPHYYRPSQVRAYTFSNATRLQKQHGSHGGFGSMRSPRNDLAQARALASFRKDYVKHLDSKSVRSDSASHRIPFPTTIKHTPRPAGGFSPMKSSASVSSDTKSSKAVRGQNARHQHSNSAESNSGLNPETACACTSTHADASKSVRNMNARAKRISSFSSRPRTISDAKSTNPVGKNSRSSETQRTTSAGGGAKSSASRISTAAGGGTKSSALQTSTPAGGGAKSSASRTGTSAGGGAKSSASRTGTPAGGGAKSFTSRTGTPAGGGAKSSASGTGTPAGGGAKSSASRTGTPAGGGAKSSASQTSTPAGNNAKSSKRRR